VCNCSTMLAVQLSDDLLEQGREKKEEAASTDCDQVCLSGQGQVRIQQQNCNNNNFTEHGI